uniref:Uncharacterized protein n=1 Tax=Oryza barthii TaxID=65489 RepID=A0A0D3F5B4_9ORYZ
MAPPHACNTGATQRLLLHAAADGDLRLFKRIASRLDGGEGRLKEAVEAVKYRGAGALHQAARNGRTAMCVYLVEELQVDINAANESGATPLIYAVLGGIVDTVSYLLDHGAILISPMNKGLLLSILQLNKVLLVKGADVDSSSDCGTPLHVAAVKSHDGCMKILLDHHADCNKVFSTFYTPLIVALMVRSLKCVKLLIKAGADIKGAGTFTPLIAAATEGLTDFYKCLLEAGADPNVPDENRRKDVEILLPVTSRIPSVYDWSVDGIITYVNKNVQDDPMYKIRPADLKLEGSRAYKREDYLAATKLYTMAMNLESEDGTLYSNRSICWLKMGEGMKALTDAHLCRMLCPDWPKACYREGAAHMFLKDYDKACDAFLDGLKLDPANMEIENGLREAFKSLKKSRAA